MSRYDIDIDSIGEVQAYQQGRADKYQEITSEYMLLTEKQVEDIRADVIESAYYIIKPFMSIEEWTEEVNRQIELKEQTE